LRLRDPRLIYGKDVETIAGIVKVQYDPSLWGGDFDKAAEIAAMIHKETWPIPKDRKRAWNEIAPIEEAEKVAKSRLLTEEHLSGIVSYLFE